MSCSKVVPRKGSPLSSLDERGFCCQDRLKEDYRKEGMFMNLGENADVARVCLHRARARLKRNDGDRQSIVSQHPLTMAKRGMH